MRKKIGLLGVLALVFVLVPSFALADMGSSWPHVIWSQDYEVEGNIDDYRHVLVAADDTYNATLAIIGLNPLNVDSDIRSFLSDESYSPHFIHIASSLWRVEDWDNNVPDWVPTYVYQYLPLDPDHAYFGNVDTYEIKQAYKEYQQAREYAEDGTLPDSGGGSAPDITQGLDIPFSFDSSNLAYSRLAAHYQQFQQLSGNFTLHLNSSQAANVAGYAYIYICLRATIDNNGSPPNFQASVIYWGSNQSNPSIVSGSYDFANVATSSGGTTYQTHDRSYSSFLGAVVSDSSPYINSSSSSRWRCGGRIVWYAAVPLDSILNPAPSEPEGTWPDPEPTPDPTAPEQPSPDAPTPEPDPVVPDPDITWPGIPLVTEPLEEGLDYTGLLTAIYNQLCDMEETMVDGFLAIQRGQQNIISYLDNLDSVLELHCKHLRDALDDAIYNLELYIKSLFEWLPQQLDFDANFDYDDSSIQALLRRILSKIPGSSTGQPITYQPNPQSDEPGFFDWLLDLWHRFLIDLVSVLPDELGGLVDAFSQLTHYFPFSIPWDLAALLALFEHEPVTPVFDVPWGFGGEEGEIEMVRVDLSAWDGVMEMVRPVFLVGFCWQLAMITKELLGNFDINKGGV